MKFLRKELAAPCIYIYIYQVLDPAYIGTRKRYITANTCDLLNSAGMVLLEPGFVSHDFSIYIYIYVYIYVCIYLHIYILAIYIYRFIALNVLNISTSHTTPVQTNSFYRACQYK